MTSALEIPSHAFFSAKDKPVNFNALLLRCITQRSAISASFGPKSVTLALGRANPPDTSQVYGCWRTPELRADYASETGARLLLPLLFSPTKILLSHNRINPLLLDHRPIADFFARNLFLAMLIDMPVIWRNGPGSQTPSQGGRDFQRQYFWILKSMFSEKVFTERHSIDAIDLLFANSFIPMLQFDSALLGHGAEIFRNNLENDANTDISVLKGRLKRVRESLITLFSS